MVKAVHSLTRPLSNNALDAEYSVVSHGALLLQNGQVMPQWQSRLASELDAAKRNIHLARDHLSRANIDHQTKQLLGQRAKALGLPIWQYIQQLGLDAETLEALEKRSLQSKDCSKSC